MRRHALSWLVVIVALSCSDGRGPSEPRLVAVNARANEELHWECVTQFQPDGGEWEHCAWYGGDSPIEPSPLPPPPSNPFQATTTYYPFCESQPASCGSLVDGGGPTSIAELADNTSWQEVGVSYFNPDDEANSWRADCRFIKCPTPDQVVHDQVALQAIALVKSKTNQTGHEWGLVIYRNPDGSLRAGELIEGTASTVTLPSQDLYAVASIHSHPAGSVISRQDMQNVFDSGVYAIVTAGNNSLYVFPAANSMTFRVVFGGAGSECFQPPCN